MAVFDLNQPASSLSEEDDVAASNSHVVFVSSSNNTGCDSFASHDDNAISDIHHEFIDTPGGLVYWVPRVSVSVLPVLGTVYDSLNKCIEVYRKYASEAGFGIRLSCQKRLKCGYMKQKYIVCNRKGCPKEAWLNTSDPKKNDRQLDRVEYKHLSKAERKLTYNEQLFIIKAVNVNIGALRAHNLYTGLKGSSSLVHGWKRGKSSQKTFLFDYFVEDAEICGLFWADEVAKCNYKQFGDIVSFDATYKTNKYKMVFVPFTAIDNHRRFVTVGLGLLKKETAKAYGWLLRAFKKAFVRPPNIVVTDQDGAMRLAVVAEFPESKHRLCMWHIMQKIPAKIVSRIYDDTDFKDKF
ncbi:FAR1-related sequence 5-like protein, partial [Tanacetum coccineum]